MGRKQAVLSHHPAHAARARANPGNAQSRPYFAIAFAVKVGRFDFPADMIGQVSIRTRAYRTGATTGDRRRWRSLEKAINAGARNAPRARPAPGHNNETWKVRPSGSSSRPPSGQRAFGLNGGDLGGQQFVVHGDLAHLGLQSGDFILAIVALAFLQG